MQKKKFPIDSVVIVKNGYLIGEFYAKNNNKEIIGNIIAKTMIVSKKNKKIKDKLWI